MISAVGHETDFTIADFAADLRAPTPSAAAELAVDDFRSIVESVKTYEERLNRAMWGRVDLLRSRLSQYQVRIQYLSPQNRLRENRQRLADLEERIRGAFDRRMQDYRHRLSIYLERFAGLSPLRKLNQGYSYVADEQGKAVTSITQAKPGDRLTISVTDGSMEAIVETLRKEERV